jgi:hypothetical protein
MALTFTMILPIVRYRLRDPRPGWPALRAPVNVAPILMLRR